MTRPILFALAFLALGLATPALAQDAMYDPCRSDDLVCRIDRLERTVEQMTDRLAYYEGGHATVVAAPLQRSVDIPVRISCTGSNCSAHAAETCRAGGFPRGIPAEYRQDGGFNMLIRVTCMD